MARKSLTKCDGHVLCCPYNPLGYDCSTCPRYTGVKPQPLRALPGYEHFTAQDEPPSEDAIESVCPVCGRLFYAPKNKIYCSRFCKKKAYRQRRSERGGSNRKFPRQRCLVCGRWFRPKTSNQVTCGGPCTQKYFVKKYHRGVAQTHTVVPPQMHSGAIKNMETRTNCPVQHLKECVEQLKRHNPRTTFSPATLDSLAAMVSAKMPLVWKTISRVRQAVLLDIAMTYGVQGLLSLERFQLAVRAGHWEKARQALLNSRYASLAGRAAVENARQIVTNEWTIIPQYVPDDDDDEDDSDSVDDENGDYRFF